MALRPFEEGRNEETQPELSAQLALWGSVISTFGDALQALAAAAAIEEARTAEIQQQQQFEKLQQQIDDLKKEQAEMSDRNAMLEKMISQKSGFDNRQKK